MTDVITAKSIARNIADIEDDFILSEEPMSRLVFRAQIHRGRIIRQRRGSSDDIWIPEEAVDIRDLGKKETINLEIDTQAVKRLYLAITKLAHIHRSCGVEYGENRYAVVDRESVIITDENKTSYIRKILTAGYGQDVWENLAESNPSLVTKLSFARIQATKAAVVAALEDRLKTGGYLETTGSDSWQNWIYEHNWLFGVNYRKPIEKTKINISGIMPDFLFPTLDGFVDILEIKLSDDDVIVEDKSHPGSWK